jgi:hypothetical protein
MWSKSPPARDAHAIFDNKSIGSRLRQIKAATGETIQDDINGRFIQEENVS